MFKIMQQENKKNQDFIHKVKKILLGFFKILYKIWKILAFGLGTVVLSLTLWFSLILIILSFNQPKSDSSFPYKILKTGNNQQKILFVKLSGQIMDMQSDSLFAMDSQLITPDKIKEIKQIVHEDKTIKSVVFSINSPGGAVVPTKQIFDDLLQIREIIPVVFVFNDIAASGGYYLGSAANKIVANPATLTGSIGVIAIVPEAEELLNKIGVNVQVIKSGQNKDMGITSRPLTDQQKDIFQSIINDTYDMFIQDVAKGRDMELETVKQLADGRIYSGKQALELGLVDYLGNDEKGLEVAMNLASLNNPTIVEYKISSIWEDFALLFNESKPFAKLENNLPILEPMGVYYLFN